MQGTKRSRKPSHRRRALEEGLNEEVPRGEEATSSTNIPGTMEGRSTREDPVSREENLTAEDWAVMDAVERCPVWRAFKALNLRQREKLLAAMCLVTQESVEGNEERPTIHGVEEFRDWGRRWGQDEPEAQLLLQHQLRGDCHRHGPFPYKYWGGVGQPRGQWSVGAGGTTSEYHERCSCGTTSRQRGRST